jgi:hypothetical protein
MKITLRRLAAVVALMLAGTACFGHANDAATSELKVAKVTGDVTVQAPGGETRALREGETIRAGSAVHTAKDSSARLEGGAKRAVELASNTQATIVSADTVALDIGSALGEAGSGELSFDSRGVGVHVSAGTARLERLLGVLRVGVYAGKARVDLTGRGVDIPAFRELDFAGGIPVDRAPRPLSLNGTDQWDRRLLGDVIEFDQEISQFGTGFNNQFAGQTAEPAFYRGFVGVSNVTFIGNFSNQDPAEILIGLVMAERLQAKNGSNVQRSFASMFGERAAGATWGLIAKERGLELQTLLQGVLDAIRRGTTPSSPGGSGGGNGGGGNPPNRPTPGPTTSPKPKPTGSPSPTPSPTPTEPPCTQLERLLNLCPGSGSGSQSAGTSAPPPPDCSIVGVLIDPEC